MKRTFIVAIVFAVVVASCGGGDEDTGPDRDRFCELGTDNNAFGEQGFFELSGDKASEAADEARANLDELVKVAPVEIRSSVETLISFSHEFIDLLEAADFDVAAIDLAAMEALETAEVDASDDAVDGWIAENCPS